MSISKRILEQIKALDTDPDMRKMMIAVLRTEDGSSSQYASAYEKLIKDYLGKHPQKEEY